jgi:acetolactate synthase I/II/III large subunit
MSNPAMTGADALVRTLAECGVEICFANPGTSEMHLVTALDKEARIKSVLCLFEGVAAGAADGYARIAGKPAMTLLHLGPGYLNAGACLHNSKRAYSPAVHVVGEHATYHRGFDAPLSSDIAALVAPLARHVGVAETAADCGPAAAAAFVASFGASEGAGPPGNAFVLLPADAAWLEGGVAAPAPARPTLMHPPAPEMVRAAAAAFKAAKRPALLVAGTALSPAGLAFCAQLQAAGVGVFAATFPALHARGAGRHAIPKLPYFAEMAVDALAGFDLVMAVGCTPPVAFFAYPGKPSVLTPEGAQSFAFGGAELDSLAALQALAQEAGLALPPAQPAPALASPARPEGPLHPGAIGLSLARHLPAQAIICDEAITAGAAAYGLTEQAAPHDWLCLTGGAIGHGAPMAVGAALAAPDRKVIALIGDGSAMYTIQALWTMAREKLDVTIVIFANRSYRILTVELARTGAGQPGPAAASMLALDNPVLDFVSLARGMGVEAARCETAQDFDASLARAIGQKGPVLLEAVIG